VDTNSNTDWAASNAAVYTKYNDGWCRAGVAKSFQWFRPPVCLSAALRRHSTFGVHGRQAAASSGIVPLPFHLVKDLYDSNRLTGEKLSLRGGYRLHLLIAVESQS